MQFPVQFYGDIIQGAFISRKNIKTVLSQVRFEYGNRSPIEKERDHLFISKYGFVINEEDLQEAEVDEEGSQIGISRPTDREVDNKLFAEIIVWALDQELISCNFIMDTFHIGWKRASGFLEKLHELGIAGDMYAKLPRAVLPVCLEDLSTKIVDFLKRHGYTPDQIEEILNSKGKRP